MEQKKGKCAITRKRYQITITHLFENQTRITWKPVKLFHKCTYINAINMSVFNV